jgi:hypothetical protein
MGDRAVSGQGKIHGDADAALAYTVIAGNLVGADAISGTVSRTAGEDVGNYAIGQGTLTLSSNYTLSYVGSSFGISARSTAENPGLLLPTLLSSMNNIWSAIARQPAWLGDQAGEAPGATTGYIETSSPEGFRICRPARITLELISSGRVRLSGSDTACGR